MTTVTAGPPAPAVGGAVKRRHFITAGPEKPVLTSDPSEHIRRFEHFIDATGIPPERVLLTPVVSLPIPVSVTDGEGELERWSHVTPEMMWHPFFWLPKRVALRYQYPTIDEASGGTSADIETEGDDVWAIRVMLELLGSGVYDPTSGTWLDVLAWHGIDVEDPIDLARVQTWQDGEPDDVLDAIDMTPLIEFNPDDPDWGFHAARQFSDVVVPAQWSLTAGSLLVQLNEQITERGDSDEETRKLIGIFGRIASNGLRTIPADDSGVDTSTVLDALVEQSEDSEADCAYLMQMLRQVLAETNWDFEPHLRGLVEGGEAAGGSDITSQAIG